MGNFKSQSTSSSVSSRKFNLDETDTSDIVVVNLAGKLRNGYKISSQKDLCNELDKDPQLRCSRKHIPRGCSRLEIVANDLMNEPQKTKYSKYFNARSWRASLNVPRKVYWRRLLMGHFPNLYIISPDHSSANSADGSQDSSPTATATHNDDPITWSAS